MTPTPSPAAGLALAGPLATRDSDREIDHEGVQRGHVGREKNGVHDEGVYTERDIELQLGPPPPRRPTGATRATRRSP